MDRVDQQSVMENIFLSRNMFRLAEVTSMTIVSKHLKQRRIQEFLFKKGVAKYCKIFGVAD